MGEKKIDFAQRGRIILTAHIHEDVGIDNHIFWTVTLKVTAVMIFHNKAENRVVVIFKVERSIN